MSVRWQAGSIVYITRMNIQHPGDSPDCILGVVPQLTDSRLSETKLPPASFSRARLARPIDRVSRLIGRQRHLTFWSYGTPN